jgi:hypothetical protein
MQTNIVSFQLNKSTLQAYYELKHAYSVKKQLNIALLQPNNGTL